MVLLDSDFGSFLNVKNELKNGTVGAALRTVGLDIAGTLACCDLNAVLSVRRGAKLKRIRLVVSILVSGILHGVVRTEQTVYS